VAKRERAQQQGNDYEQYALQKGQFLF